MNKNITIAVLAVTCFSLLIWGFAGHSGSTQVPQNNLEQLPPMPEQPASHSGGFLSSIFKYTPAADSVPANGEDFTKEAQYIYDGFQLQAFKSLKVTSASVEKESISGDMATFNFFGEADVQLHQGPVYHIHFLEQTSKCLSRSKPTYIPNNNMDTQGHEGQILSAGVSSPTGETEEDSARAGLSLLNLGLEIDRLYGDSEHFDNAQQPQIQNWIDYNPIAWSNREKIIYW